MGKNVDFESIKATALAMVRVEPTRAEGNFGFLVYLYMIRTLIPLNLSIALIKKNIQDG